ncbi:hypothetical protein, partial [Undibacterium sp.]|uniref:hypothetical protein n=1 Tax=Undibacterium sp. TaxID=1914977 RepID=UPI00374D4677
LSMTLPLIWWFFGLPLWHIAMPSWGEASISLTYNSNATANLAGAVGWADASSSQHLQTSTSILRRWFFKR